MYKKERPDDGYPWELSPNRPWFFYDPDGDGFMYYATEEERDQAAKAAINGYLDDGWSESVANIVAGKVTHAAGRVNSIPRPAEDEIDEEGHDNDGNYWAPEWGFQCDYSLLPISDPVAGKY